MAAPGSPSEPSPPVVVPHTNRNPIRSLRPTSVVFGWQGKEFEIPALPAADWLEVLMDPQWVADEVILALLPDGQELLNTMDPDDLNDLVLDLIEEVTGRHWWIADRLISALAGSWDVMGAEAVLHQVDPERLSLAAWLDAMLLLTLRRIDPEKAAMFTARLETPPPGEEMDLQEMEISPEQFMAMGDD